MIRLGQLLKAAGLVDTGGEAKLRLADEQVTFMLSRSGSSTTVAVTSDPVTVSAGGTSELTIDLPVLLVALGLIERVIPGRSNVGHQRKIGPERAEQRQQRTRQCEV